MECYVHDKHISNVPETLQVQKFFLCYPTLFLLYDDILPKLCMDVMFALDQVQKK